VLASRHLPELTQPVPPIPKPGAWVRRQVIARPRHSTDAYGGKSRLHLYHPLRTNDWDRFGLVHCANDVRRRKVSWRTLSSASEMMQPQLTNHNASADASPSSYKAIYAFSTFKYKDLYSVFSLHDIVGTCGRI